MNRLLILLTILFNFVGFSSLAHIVEPSETSFDIISVINWENWSTQYLVSEHGYHYASISYSDNDDTYFDFLVFPHSESEFYLIIRDENESFLTMGIIAMVDEDDVGFQFETENMSNDPNYFMFRLPVETRNQFRDMLTHLNYSDTIRIYYYDILKFNVDNSGSGVMNLETALFGLWLDFVNFYNTAMQANLTRSIER